MVYYLDPFFEMISLRKPTNTVFLQTGSTTFILVL